jgi:hypothetical protein
MPLWRIRVFRPDDPDSLTAVTDVRAEQPASQLRVILGVRSGQWDLLRPATHDVSPEEMVTVPGASPPAGLFGMLT